VDNQINDDNINKNKNKNNNDNKVQGFSFMRSDLRLTKEKKAKNLKVISSINT
jgi:hypothetical protein